MPILVGLVAGVIAAVVAGVVMVFLGGVGPWEMALAAVVGVVVGALAGVSESRRRR
ncbi:hypothetical protein [Microtetraspora malaysiensis]|uniref:hypothetical protein n=1 Tax=Microtetraspora malaysiensis TaxID=161358 RepID=UPI003D904B4D